MDLKKDEKIWLVRSSGRIIGPFEASELQGLFKQRVITPIDEIRTPTLSWVLVRDHELFRNLTLDSKNESTEVTHTATSTEKTHTTTIEEKSTVLNDNAKTKIETVDPIIPIKSSIPQQNSYLPESQTIKKTKLAPSFVIYRPALIFILTALLFVAAGLLWKNWQNYKTEQTLINQMTEARNKARIAFKQWKFDEATELYDQVYFYKKGLLEPFDILNYALMLSLSKTRFNDGLSLVDEIDTFQFQNQNDILNFETLKLKKLIYRNQLDLVESYIKQKQSQNNDKTAKEFWDIRLAEVLFLKGEFDKLKVLLKQLNGNTLSPFNRGLERLLILLTYWRTLQQPDPEIAENVQKIVSRPPKSFSPLIFFEWLISSYLLILTDQTNVLPLFFSQIPSQNIFDVPFFTHWRLKSSFILVPDIWVPLCDDTFNLASQKINFGDQSLFYQDVMNVLKSFCYFLFKDDSSWQNIIVEARKVRPSSSILAAGEVNLLQLQERMLEAGGRLVLCHDLPWCRIGKIRECLHKKLPCLELANDMVSFNWLGPLYYVFIEQIETKRANTFKAQDARKKLEAEYPDYILPAILW